jgi:hypothetical protein
MEPMYSPMKFGPLAALQLLPCMLFHLFMKFYHFYELPFGSTTPSFSHVCVAAVVLQGGSVSVGLASFGGCDWNMNWV